MLPEERSEGLVATPGPGERPTRYPDLRGVYKCAKSTLSGSVMWHESATRQQSRNTPAHPTFRNKRCGTPSPYRRRTSVLRTGRKSVVLGKRGDVRYDIGGRGSVQKKTKKI